MTRSRSRSPVRIIGSYLSPYVRKVLVCLDLKGLAYEIDPIVPFLGDDRFSKLSPIAERAQARWLEEFADSRMGEVLIWRLFNQVAINPFVWGEPTDGEVLKKTLEVEIPEVLDYLEAQVPREGFLFGAPSIADISIACFFRNAAFARFRVDPGRWPGTASFVDRVLSLDCFEKLKPFEERLMRTPIPKHRSVLAEMGAPLSDETWGTTAPRRGVMRI